MWSCPYFRDLLKNVFPFFPSFLRRTLPNSELYKKDVGVFTYTYPNVRGPSHCLNGWNKQRKSPRHYYIYKVYHKYIVRRYIHTRGRLVAVSPIRYKVAKFANIEVCVNKRPYRNRLRLCTCAEGIRYANIRNLDLCG